MFFFLVAHFLPQMGDLETHQKKVQHYHHPNISMVFKTCKIKIIVVIMRWQNHLSTLVEMMVISRWENQTMLIGTSICYKVQTTRWRLTQKMTLKTHLQKQERKITNGNGINKLDFVRQNYESKKRFILPRRSSSLLTCKLVDS